MPETDEFWSIALADHIDGLKTDNDRISESSEDDHDGATPTVYALHGPSSSSSIRLYLSPLPLTEGVCSSLGAQAWYGSALLTSFLLLEEEERTDTILPLPQGSQNVYVLELGSGAVGLSGFALWWKMAHTSMSSDSSCQVILTDCDAAVLAQLASNVQTNMDRIATEMPNQKLPAIRVEALDWSSPDTLEQLVPSTASLPLVIGSELVDSQETAWACSKMVSRILHQHEETLVVLIQVVDREGWSNTFLPSLRQQGFVVKEQDILDDSLHDRASLWIRHGGTLDRFDFGSCYIHREGWPSKSS